MQNETSTSLSAQGVVERVINVRYYYYYLRASVCVVRCVVMRVCVRVRARACGHAGVVCVLYFRRVCVYCVCNLIKIIVKLNDRNNKTETLLEDRTVTSKRNQDDSTYNTRCLVNQ